MKISLAFPGKFVSSRRHITHRRCKRVGQQR
nr:MAG TPA: hypothetical protein [Bacteriophage sp.]